MLRAIKGFIKKISDAPQPNEANKQHVIHLAVSVLLVEMMRIDGDVSEEEKVALKKSLSQKFDVSDEEKDELMQLADQELNSSIDYYQFTSVINQYFTRDEKNKMIEELWRVAFADGQLDSHEEHYIRKINALIHVSHQDFIQAKHSALN